MGQNKYQNSFVEELAFFESHAVRARQHLRRITCRIKDPKARRAINAIALEYFSKADDVDLPSGFIHKKISDVLSKSQPPKAPAAPDVVSLID